MSKFEILCVTMHQNDFSKIQEMNIHSDVVFANQCDHTSYEEIEYKGHSAKMISTQTRGVGVNRNLALTYASAEYCLFADDDVVYCDDLEGIVVGEFEAHPDADVFVFHLDTSDPVRKQQEYPRTRKCKPFEKKPWGGVRIAVKLSAVRKANVWFTTLFGGGCVFPSGEDSMWLRDASRKGLTFYVSGKTIGTVSFDDSSWFTGYDEKFFFGKGAFCKARSRRCFFLWMRYYLWRYAGKGSLTYNEKLRWMRIGAQCYDRLIGFDGYCELMENKLKKE